MLGQARGRTPSALQTKAMKPNIRVQTGAVSQRCSTGEPSRQGVAWLIGCGPGSIDYLTLKAVRLIKEAEVILYDDLGTQAAVEEFASEEAVKVFVGKRGAAKAYQQAEIDAMLVQHCQQGKKVARLKGGCPSVFSRVSSELAALSAAGMAAELVPGVSSALAAPLLAGFPLTDRDVGRSFAVVSAHAPDQVQWDAHRGIDTLVLLMAGSMLQQSVAGMLQAGWPSNTPAAIVREAGLPQQQVWRAQLGGIVEATAGAGALSPCVMIVGQVVGLVGR